MSIADNMLRIVREEMARHGLEHLRVVRVRCGVLTNVIPDALRFSFGVLVHDGPWAGARLDIVPVPVELRCARCGERFAPQGREALFIPCPRCGGDSACDVVQGKEFYIENIEAE